MANAKPEQRARLLMEFGHLTAPFADLRQATQPEHKDYLIATAKVQAGQAAWSATVKDFTTSASDLFMRDQFSAITATTEEFCRTLRKRILTNKTDLEWVKREYDPIYDAYIAKTLALVAEVPVDWEPEIFEANTPLTAYLRIRQAFASATSRLTYIDRYLSVDFFRLFLSEVDRKVSVTLVTTAKAVKIIEPVSALACQEFGRYQLVEAPRTDFHDRNLLVDGHVFTLGPGADRAGMVLTNFGPSDTSPRALAAFDKIIASGRVVHKSP